MDRINLHTSETPEVRIIKVDGSLRIKGWDRGELRADSDKADTLTIDSINNSIKVECKSGCMIRLPVESLLQIERVERELMLKSIECKVDVGHVSGQIMAKSIGPLKIEKASSNLIARNIEGGLDCGLIAGNANLQDIDGPIRINKLNGNLVINGFTSGIYADTNGNTNLRLDPETGGEYHINSKGNITCRLSPDTSAKIKLVSGANHINVNVAGSSKTHNTGEYEFSVGDGESQITLIALGAVDLAIPIQDEVDWSYEFDLDDDMSSVADDISQIVSEQIESQLEILTENINDLTTNLSNLGPFTSGLNREKLEAKRNKLERKLARVERRTVEKVKLANKRATAAARRISRQQGPSDPVSDSERQKVLEMLQQKQISVKDAEILLASLEGREPEFSGNDQDKPDKPIED